jgi:hypothetical protein
LKDHKNKGSPSVALPSVIRPGRDPRMSDAVKKSCSLRLHKHTMTTAVSLPLLIRDVTKPAGLSVEFILQDERDKEAIVHGKSKRNLPPMQKSSFYAAAEQLVPLTVKTATQRNTRRLQSLLDMFAAISMSVVAWACLCPEGIADGRLSRVKASNMYNLDAVSILAGGKVNSKVRCAKETKKALKDLGISIGVESTTKKERGIKQYYLTCADGKLVVAVIIIKDNHIKDISYDKIHDSEYTGYDLFVIYVPNNQSTKPTATADDRVPHDANLDLNGDDPCDDILSADIGQDKVVMQTIFLNMFLPCIQRRRDKPVVLTTSVLPPIQYTEASGDAISAAIALAVVEATVPVPALSDVVEPTLLTLDGDFPQIETVFLIMDWLNKHFKCEIFKFPGGGSLQWQPNDLMVSFSMIHAFCSSSLYSRNLETTTFVPDWLPLIQSKLSGFGIDKASRDCFSNFFRQIPEIISKSFNITSILRGWQLSGLSPLDTNVMMSKCLKWNDNVLFSEEDQERIRVGIDHLKNVASLQTGICTDEDILIEFGTLVDTELKDMWKKPVIQQRAIWFNSNGQTNSGVFLLRQQDLEKRRVAEEKKLKAAAAKTAKALVDAAIVVTQANAALPPLIARERTGRCGHECGFMLRAILSEGEDDNWRGCNYCALVFCHKVNCQKKRNAHEKHCQVIMNMNTTA